MGVLLGIEIPLAGKTEVGLGNGAHVCARQAEGQVPKGDAITRLGERKYTCTVQTQCGDWFTFRGTRLPQSRPVSKLPAGSLLACPRDGWEWS